MGNATSSPGSRGGGGGAPRERMNDVDGHVIAAHEAFFVSILGEEDLDDSCSPATSAAAAGGDAKRANRRGISTPPTDDGEESSLASSSSSDGEATVGGTTAGTAAAVTASLSSSSSALLPPLALSSFLPLLSDASSVFASAPTTAAPSLAGSDSDDTTTKADDDDDDDGGYRQYHFSDVGDEGGGDNEAGAGAAAACYSTVMDNGYGGDLDSDSATTTFGCVRRPLTLVRRRGDPLVPLEESDLQLQEVFVKRMRSNRRLLRSYVSECWSSPFDGDDEDDNYDNGEAATDEEDEDGVPSSRQRRRRKRKKSSSLGGLGGGGSRFLSMPSFRSEPSLAAQLPYTKSELSMVDGDEPTPDSDLRPRSRGGQGTRDHRTFHVVTTACLPWFTGTAVNPLLRAAYLSRMNREARKEGGDEDEGEGGSGAGAPHCQPTVTLVIPWLYDKADRRTLYGERFGFETESDQEMYIREWLRDKAMLPLEADVRSGGIRILFYPARYHNYCIFAMGDICSLIPDEEADVCIMEEPEHLNWYREPGVGSNRSWTTKFTHVVGIIHTNYKSYAASHYSGIISAPFISKSSSLICRAYCHKVVKLSDTLQTFAPEKEVVSNIHGIRSEFLEAVVGDRGEQSSSAGLHPTMSRTTCGVYFIGKLLWAKGLDKLLDLQDYYRELTGSYFEIDIFGSGPEEVEIKRAFYGRELHDAVSSSEKKRPTGSKGSAVTADTVKRTDSKIDLPKSRYEWRRNPIPARFPGRRDHAQLRGNDYRVFINPSLTEVLCTTTAEALAMGKFVIIPHHPSNTWFEQFPNCLAFRSRFEFVSLLQYALHNEPTPLSPELSRELTWEAATERCIEAAVVTRREERRRERLGMTKSDERIAKNINTVLGGPKGDVIRKMLGAGPVADQFYHKIGRVQSLKA